MKQITISKFGITYYPKAKRKVKADIEKIGEQHLACQVRSNLKTKRLSKVEIEALTQKMTTSQELLKC